MKEIRVGIMAEGPLPEYKTDGAAGMDLRAYLEAPVTLAPGKRALIPTGLRLELPTGYEAQVRARSGLATQYGIGIVNGVGTVDSDYRGEIKVCLINWSEEDFVVHNGDRIAQLVIAESVRVILEKACVLTDTERGRGGFGHTGIT